MTKLLTKNGKMAASASDKYTVFNFGIPAYRAQSGLVTCPNAGTCGKAAGCYALQGSYTWTPVKAAYEYRLAATQRPTFAAELAAELATKVKTATRQGRTVVVRVHDSGDFYSLAYAKVWMQIAADHPSVKFYAYTKMVALARTLTKQGLVPSNFTWIFSEGGTQDQLINHSVDRHSRVFGSLDELHAAGYADSTEDDLVAAFGENHKIGLVYHGYKSATWTTSKE
jgi:hypothetical protein